MQIIKIFVSSVFKEMQKERDLINRQITGIVNRRLREHGFDAEVVFLDFRWGLDLRKKLEDDVNDDVVDMCISSIDDCDIFLGLIGYDTGTKINKNSEIDFAESESLSITEAEILYGINNLQYGSCLFLIKKDDETSSSKFYEFVKRNYDLNNEEYFYKSLNSGKAENEFINMLADLVILKVSYNYKNKVQQGATQDYIIRQPLLDECFQAFHHEGVGLIIGDSGVGKSEVLRSFYHELQKENCVTYFDRGTEKHSIKNVVLSWIRNKDNLDEFASIHEIVAIFVKQLISEKTKCIIIFDSLDHLNEFELYVFLDQVINLDKSKIKVFMATTNEKYIDMTRFTGRRVIEINNFTKKEISDYIDFISSKYNKQFFAEVKETIINHEKLPMNYPLYLSAIVHDLMVIDRDTFVKLYNNNKNYEEQLINFMIHKINNYPNSIGEMTIFRLKELNKYIDNEVSQLFYGLMAVKELPLTIDILKKIHEDKLNREWNDVDFITFIHILKSIVTTENGILRFTHDKLKQIALESLDNNQEKELRAVLIIHELTGDFNTFEIIFQTIKSSNVVLLEKIYEILHENHEKHFLHSLLKAVERILLDCFQERKDCIYIKYLLKELTKSQKLSSYISMLLYYLNVNDNFSQFPIEIIDFYKFGINLIIRFTEDLDDNKSTLGVNLCIADKIISFASTVGAEVQVKDLLLISERMYFELFEHEQFSNKGNHYLDILFHIARVHQGLDRLDDAKRLFDHIRDRIINEKIDVSFINMMSDYYMKRRDDNTAKLLIEFGIEIYSKKPDDVLHLCWSYNKGAFIALKEKDKAKAIRYGKKSYEIAEKEYKINPTKADVIYLYSAACNAMAWVCRLEGEDKEVKEYERKNFELKRYLHKARPNDFVLFDSYAGTAMLMTQSERCSPDELLTIVSDLIGDIVNYAERTKSIQAAWTFTNVYDFVVKSDRDFLCKLLIQKLPLFSMVLDLVVIKNKNSFVNIEELTNLLLNIYDSFCKQKKLPLENGRDFLMLPYKSAKILIEMELNYDSVVMMKRVSGEIFMIDMQIGSDALIGESTFLKTYGKFVDEKCMEMKNEPYSKLLKITAIYLELFSIMYMETQTPNDKKASLVKEMLFKEIGIDIRQMMLDKIEEISELAVCIEHKINIPQDIMVMTVGAGKFILGSELTKIHQKEKSLELMKKLSIIHDRMYDKKMNEIANMKII